MEDRSLFVVLGLRCQERLCDPEVDDETHYVVLLFAYGLSVCRTVLHGSAWLGSPSVAITTAPPSSPPY